MKISFFLAVVLLISVSLFGCSTPVQQLSQTQLSTANNQQVYKVGHTTCPVCGCTTPVSNTQPAKIAWYDTETADMIAYPTMAILLGGSIGYLIGSLLKK